MGLSFDLNVTELPDKILDLAFASHAWFDSTNGMTMGYSENPLDVNGDATGTGSPGWITGGFLDIVSTGRWAGIQPVPGSWVINDIKTANGTVFLCGSYAAQWKGNDWMAAGYDTNPDLMFDANSVDPSFSIGQPFVDGFFACCRYDLLDNPKAWHILPTRSLIEIPEMVLPNNAILPDGITPINNYVATNTQGGLYDMVIDIRTENPDVRRGWEAETAELAGQPQPVVVTCVGYMPCEGYGSTVHNSTWMTDSYKWSIYSNQDFLPVVYSFVVNMFDDKYNGKDLYMTNGETAENCINPYYANTQVGFPNAGIGGDESEDVLQYWNFNWLIGGILGVNPNANDGYSGIDWNGSSIATQGAFCGAANAISLQDVNIPDATLRRPYISAAARFGSLQVFPLEQVTYRAHQIGMRGTFSGPFYPMGNTTDTWTAYANTHPRQPAVNAFWPTPLIGTFPIRKPTEMAFATPNYVPVNTSLYVNTKANTGQNEFNPTPNYFGPSKQLSPVYRQSAQTDAEIWRHGFIPRRLTGVERSYNSYANAGPKGGVYYPTYEYSPNFFEGASVGPVGQFYFTSAISQMVFTGDCLEDVKPNPNAQLTCKVDGAGNPVYSPLCVVANMGQAIAGSDGLNPETQYIQKGMPYTGDVTVTEPLAENYMCNTHFMCLTRRNIYVEDVNAEDYWGNNPENTSLDFATFVKPLPVVHGIPPAINNQVFNVNLLLQSNETTVGTNERRAEIYTLQPWTLNPQTNGLPMDMVAIVPMMTWWGRGERLYEEGPCFVTPLPTPNNLAYLPSEWTQQKTQGIPLSISDVSKQRNCFHRYLQPTNYVYGTSVGLGQMVNGYWDARTLPTVPTGGNPKSGPQVMVFDPGTTKIDIRPNEDDWVVNPLDPTWGGIYRFGFPEGLFGDTNDSPCIYDYLDQRISVVAQVNNKISNQLYSIPTTNQTKTGPVTPLPNAWQGGLLNWSITNINGADLTATYGASPNPPPTLQYTTIESLVIDLNTAMTYVKGAGVPYSLVYGVGGGRSLNGLDGLTWYATSDKQGVYLRNANPELAGGNNVSMGVLDIGHNAARFTVDYYPWNADSLNPLNQWTYPPIQGPVATFSALGIRQGGIANVGEPTISDLTFKVDAFGDTFNENCPGGATTTRRPACADYDLDRAQWMVTFADNDKAVSEEGNGFAAISTTADFAEFLDQTQNFTDVPDFFRVAQILNTANTNIYANSLWAARQGSANFDGMVYIGVGAPNITRTYPPLTTTTGISSSTYVWAYWYCNPLIDINGFPWVGVKPKQPNYSYAGPECATAAILAAPPTGWELGRYLPPIPDWLATGITPTCFSASQPYVIKGTTGRTVQVWLNYVLYDAIDSIIAVEVMNLGLRVTPENVEWYKRKIMGQDGAEMTLEEVEQWMEQQRNQYQDILKERNRNYRMRRRREEAGSDKPSATESLGEQVAGDFYALDEHTIEELLPQLRKLPPNPDTDEMMDVDAFGNTSSGDIQKTEEKRRDSEN